MKLMLIHISVIVLFMTNNFSRLNMQNMEMSIDLYNSNCNLLMNKLNTLPSGNITLLMIIYLLLTRIIVSNIISVYNYQLRSK